MLTWGSKFFFAVSFVALIAAVIYGLVTGGDPIGVLSSGYKGGVGDHVGYTILLGAFLSTFTLGVMTVMTRDGDAEVMAARAGVEQVPPVTPPAGGSYWGILGAFGVACLIIGVAVNMAFLILGLAVLFVAGVQWLALAWSDRATGDPEVNEIVRGRVMSPIEIPMMSMLITAVVAVGIAQVFLAASKIGAVVAGTIVTVIIFGSAAALSKVDVKRGVLSGLVALGAIGFLAGGIIGAAIGPRSFEHEHEEEHSEEGEHSEDGEDADAGAEGE